MNLKVALNFVGFVGFAVLLSSVHADELKVAEGFECKKIYQVPNQAAGIMGGDRDSR